MTVDTRRHGRLQDCKLSLTDSIPHMPASIDRILREEAALWYSAREGQQTPLTVMSRLGPMVLLSAALMWAITGSMPPASFPLLTRAGIWAAIAGFVLPTALFYSADKCALDADTWRWLGPTQKHAQSTSEIERNGAFVLHRMNTY